MEPEVYGNRKVLQLATSALQKVIDAYKQGRAIKVSISMPPRYGKSLTVSLFSTYWLGTFPDSSFLRASATNRLYQKFSYDCRQIIRSDKYKNVFPEIRLAADKQSLDGWNLESAKQVSFFGGGYGTSIIGFGCNCACTDDMYPGITEALSENYNESLNTWKQGSFNSRLEKNSPEIFVGTRWSKGDLIGQAIEAGLIDVEVLIPALDENNESTCDHVKTTAEYLKIKQDTDESIWLAEYMQQPAELEGLLFPASGLKYFEPGNIPAPEFKYLAVDPADTGGDDTSAPFCDLICTGIYVTDVIYNTNGTDVNIPALVEAIVTRRLNHAEIEGVSAWKVFAKDVRNKVQERYEDCEIRVTVPHTNKVTRILSFSAFIKNHFYFLSEAHWTPEYRKFMKVLTSYMREGGSKRDDAPDSLAIAAEYFMKNFSHLW
jgi:predicted phage terminase large subunit-like protein